MSLTRLSGPLIVPSTGPQLSGINEYNDVYGPSCFAHGVGIVDNRFGPYGGADISVPLPVWFGSGFLNVLDQAPSALSATNIAAAQAPTAGTALTLAGASTGVTVLAAPFSLITNQIFPTGALVLDGNPAFAYVATPNTSTGTGGPAPYDPRTMVSRAVTVTSAGNDSGGTMSIVGVDVYGYTIHQTVTLANAGTVTTAKCFKAIISCTPLGTLSGSNISVGTADVYEFPLAVYEFPFTWIYWNGALISATTGFTAAVTTSPATALTGDVRGTYAVQSASNGTKKLQVFVQPQAWNLSSTGLFGVTNF